MKKIIVGMMITALMALACLPAMAAVELKFGHYASETHPGHEAVMAFAEAVEKRTNDEVTVKIYPSNALGSPPEVLEQNVLGVIDMSLPTQGALDNYVKAFAVVMLSNSERNENKAATSMKPMKEGK